MDAIACIEGRRSVRKFIDKEIGREVVSSIVSHAVYAPSWKNCQPVRYNVILDPQLRERFASECVFGDSWNAGIIRSCRALVVVSIVHGRSGFERDGSFTTSKEDRWEVFDAGIAAQTFCLSAHEAGLGTVIMGVFDEKPAADVAGLPQGEIAAALIAMGYYEGSPSAPRRKTAEDVLRFL